MIACQKINSIPSDTNDLGDDWKSIRSAFSGCEKIELTQAWLSEEQKDFSPATVFVGWTEGQFHLLADLEDVDIFNPIKTDGEPAFLKGDVFEMFFRPLSQSSYVELHVTPGNAKFQLCIPSAEQFAEQRSSQIPDSWFIRERKFSSKIQINPDQQCWTVYASVSASMIYEDKKELIEEGDEWLFSFSRYDYTRGKKQPVLSSSSEHKKLSFHRQLEWKKLRFVS